LDLKSCTIRRVFYPRAIDNDLSGVPVFTIAEFWAPDTIESFVGKGSIINPREGLTLTLANGSWSPHTFRGKTSQQFNFEFGKIEAPTDVAGIFRYLVKHAKFVGPGIGQKLVDKYGEATLDEIKQNPARVAFEIKGLSKERAITIAEDLQQNEENEAAMVELEGLLGDVAGLPKSLIPAVIREYGSGAVDTLRGNPYLLTRFTGVGFILADRVAMDKIAIDADSIFRKKACIRHVVSGLMQAGHVWVHIDSVVDDALGLIGRNVRNTIDKMVSDGVMDRRFDFVTPSTAAQAEKIIADTVRALLSGTPAPLVTCLECFGGGCGACGGLGRVQDFGEIEEVI